MKKVGIITYYGKNYGGMLQAYALQRVVKQNGYDCKIISNDFLNIETKFKKVKKIAKKLIYVGFNLTTYFKKRKAMRRYPLQRDKNAEKFEKFLKANIEIDYTGYTKYKQYLNSPPQYDIYLMGSDQIWNPNLYMDNGFYFAEFAPKSSFKISYASSIGVSAVTKKQAKFMKPLLNDIDIISTREDDGAKIVEAITNKKARVVLDPTLLLNKDEWSAVANPIKFNEPYVFV